MKTKTLHAFLQAEKTMEDLAEKALEKKDFEKYGQLTKALNEVRFSFLVQLDRDLAAGTL